MIYSKILILQCATNVISPVCSFARPGCHDLQLTVVYIYFVLNSLFPRLA